MAESSKPKPKPAARKCGHCHQAAGHDIRTCPLKAQEERDMATAMAESHKTAPTPEAQGGGKHKSAGKSRKKLFDDDGHAGASGGGGGAIVDTPWKGVKTVKAYIEEHPTAELREFIADDADGQFTKGWSKFANVDSGFAAFKEKDKMDRQLRSDSAPGVYEWGIQAPGHGNNKVTPVYFGKADVLQNRLANYIHPDGVYPAGEKEKTALFLDLQARGFKFHVRYRSTTADPLDVEAGLVRGQAGLHDLDWAFNSMDNGGEYREPVLPGGKRIQDYPLL
jgi:hypothetical protein